MIKVGDTLLDGKLVVASVDTATGQIVVVVPPDKDQFGNPFTLTITPAQTIAGTEAIIRQILAFLGL